MCHCLLLALLWVASPLGSSTIPPTGPEYTHQHHGGEEKDDCVLLSLHAHTHTTQGNTYFMSEVLTKMLRKLMSSDVF